MSDIGDAFEKLVHIMEVLRGPNGCPWDREQTHESLKKYLMEETCEVIDAIDAKDIDELRSELGDLLLQVIFHAQLAKEEGLFDIKDVIEGISSKLVRRHPHVFGKAEVASAEEVLHRWEEIKASEKGFGNRTSVLDGVPRSLPALMRALEISKRAAQVGFEWTDINAVVDKLDEEIHELKQELTMGQTERASEEIGDLLFTAVNVARWLGVNPEDSLRNMIDRFTQRFRKIEEYARKRGSRLEEMSIEEMEEIWNRAKQEN
jgi:tetrapyrrole methylase family protein/MazG family protein